MSEQTIYQVGTVGCILNGIIDGFVTIEELLKHGDTGLGTFEGTEGEMVVVDGTCYQTIDGQSRIADLANKTPFAMVTHFQADKKFTLENIENYEQLELELDKHIESKNDMYVIKIEGSFSNVGLRCLKKQTKPYKKMSELPPGFKHHSTLEHSNGSIAGLYYPPFMEGINVVGHHLHYVDKEAKKGGHLFAITIETAKVAICRVKNLQLTLPDTEKFMTTKLSVNEDAQALDEN